jgi:hypothetical protein
MTPPDREDGCLIAVLDLPHPGKLTTGAEPSFVGTSAHRLSGRPADACTMTQRDARSAA